MNVKEKVEIMEKQEVQETEDGQLLIDKSSLPSTSNQPSPAENNLWDVPEAHNQLAEFLKNSKKLDESSRKDFESQARMFLTGHIDKLDGFAIEKKVTLLFMLKVPVKKEFLNKLNLVAEVIVARNNTILRYKSKIENGLVLDSTNASLSSQKFTKEKFQTVLNKSESTEGMEKQDIELRNSLAMEEHLFRFLALKSFKSDAPGDINQIAKEVVSKNEEKLERFRKKLIRQIPKHIPFIEWFHSWTKIRLMFFMQSEVTVKDKFEEVLKEHGGKNYLLDIDRKIVRFTPNDPRFGPPLDRESRTMSNGSVRGRKIQNENINTLDTKKDVKHSPKTKNTATLNIDPTEDEDESKEKLPKETTVAGIAHKMKSVDQQKERGKDIMNDGERGSSDVAIDSVLSFGQPSSQTAITSSLLAVTPNAYVNGKEQNGASESFLPNPNPLLNGVSPKIDCSINQNVDLKAETNTRVTKVSEANHSRTNISAAASLSVNLVPNNTSQGSTKNMRPDSGKSNIVAKKKLLSTVPNETYSTKSGSTITSSSVLLTSAASNLTVNLSNQLTKDKSSDEVTRTPAMLENAKTCAPSTLKPNQVPTTSTKMNPQQNKKFAALEVAQKILGPMKTDQPAIRKRAAAGNKDMEPKRAKIQEGGSKKSESEELNVFPFSSSNASWTDDNSSQNGNSTNNEEAIGNGASSSAQSAQQSSASFQTPALSNEIPENFKVSEIGFTTAMWCSNFEEICPGTNKRLEELIKSGTREIIKVEDMIGPFKKAIRSISKHSNYLENYEGIQTTSSKFVLSWFRSLFVHCMKRHLGKSARIRQISASIQTIENRQDWEDLVIPTKAVSELLFRWIVDLFFEH